MRPVAKLDVGESVTTPDGNTLTIQAVYTPYRNAKEALVANIGWMCSYCENAYHLERDIQVEHVQPKSLPQYFSIAQSWSNFLLSCPTCNGMDNKGDKDVVLSQVHLPHRNNTFKSLLYRSGGVVMVNPELQGVSYQHAQALLSLVGLDKGPMTSKSNDKRWQKRSEDWNIAVRYRRKYEEGNCDVETIIDLVKSMGGWSIWYTVFDGCDAVRRHLIDDIPGTCADCFDANNHYAPIDRNPGLTDPV